MRKSIFSVSGNESGQVLVIGLIVCIGLFLASITVANVGMVVAEKIQLQDTVDASAYSAAVVEARYMNLSAYVNRAMIANYNSMAFNTALWALSDSLDHGIAVVTALLYQIDAVLAAFPLTTAFSVSFDSAVCDTMREVHSFLHTFNDQMDDLFAQDNTDLNQYIEIFNIDILTMYQGLLYAAMQSSRHSVIEQVAKKTDPEVLTTSILGLGAETVSFDELSRAVDYVIRDPEARDDTMAGFIKPFNKAFDKMGSEATDRFDEDELPKFLTATTEASLDRFAAGRTRDGRKDNLREIGNVGNILADSGAIDAVEAITETLCEIENGLCLGLCGLDCDTEISMGIGAQLRDGHEKGDEEHVPFIARQRMREVNLFGLSFHIKFADGNPLSAAASLMGDVIDLENFTLGHTSGTKENDSDEVHNKPYFMGLNYLNALESMLGGVVASVPELAWLIPVDSHWDGTYDSEPVHTYEVWPPGGGLPDALEYIGDVASEGYEQGVPSYDWQVDLDNVGFPLYHYPTDGATRRPDASSGGGGDKNLLTGPSIAVIGVKPQGKINGLQGLGIGNPYSMTAVSRSQVYYVRNPNRPDELPSLFNPHWVARLAPIDADDTPELLRKGLPYVASVGVAISPTH